MHNYFFEITELADKYAPDEICGFLFPDGKGSMKFMLCRNTQKAEQFAVDPHDVIRAYNSGPVTAFVHSHCQNDATFSPDDLDGLARTQVPWFIYSTKTRLFSFKRPPGVFPNFQGREFILGLQDCAGLVIDYFDSFFGLKIPFFTRTEINLSHGYALDCSTLRNLGFEDVLDGSIRPHDIVLMKYNFNMPVTHAGVIVREDLLLHQPRGKVSCIEQYSGVWQRLTKFVFRHPKFTSKLSVL